MDRGDGGFVIHESFKDLKARRAEQEEYRRALEEQIMQKRKLQEHDREKHKGIRDYGDIMPPTPYSSQTQKMSHLLPSPRIQPPDVHKVPDDSNNVPIPLQNGNDTSLTTPLCGQRRPPSRGGRVLLYNDMDNFNEPHPAAVTTHMENKSDLGSGCHEIPMFTPECLKYLQQVLPGFSLSPTPVDYICSDHQQTTMTLANEVAAGMKPLPMNREDEKLASTSSSQAAFSSVSTSESSSMEDVQNTKTKIHVSQTSEQLEGVKVSRKQYREELQKQIDERKRRDEELRRKAEEEEERIQEKIRIEQEKMQREYEEELRKQEEREKEAEKKRLATLAKQKEIMKAKVSKENQNRSEKACVRVMDIRESDTNSVTTATPSTSSESIESIGEFFDETTTPQGKQFIDHDDRIIPVVAKRLGIKVLHKEKWHKEGEEPIKATNQEKMSLTARINSVFLRSNNTEVSQCEGPPPPSAGFIREMAVRSAPCPSTSITGPNDLEFFSTLKNYLQCEKNKMDERILAKMSKSTEKF